MQAASASFGGAVFLGALTGGKVLFTNSRFRKNVAETAAALYVQELQDGLTLTQVHFEENKAVLTGAAIYSILSTIDEISRSVFKNNMCTRIHCRY